MACSAMLGRYPLHIGENDVAIMHLGDGDTVLDTGAEGLNPP